jgi:hypothetical protein
VSICFYFSDLLCGNNVCFRSIKILFYSCFLFRSRQPIFELDGVPIGKGVGASILKEECSSKLLTNSSKRASILIWSPIFFLIGYFNFSHFPAIAYHALMLIVDRTVQNCIYFLGFHG